MDGLFRDKHKAAESYFARMIKDIDPNEGTEGELTDEDIDERIFSRYINIAGVQIYIVNSNNEGV